MYSLVVLCICHENVYWEELELCIFTRNKMCLLDNQGVTNCPGCGGGTLGTRIICMAYFGQQHQIHLMMPH